MKKLAIFKQTVYITVEIEVNDNATKEEMEEIAYSQFNGLSEFCGNGGMDKLVGVSGSNESVEVCEDLEVAEFEDVEE